MKFLLELRRRVDPVTIHGIAVFVALLFMKLIHETLHVTMGHDAMIYDTIPLRYFIDTIHLAMLLRFALNAWRDTR